jgi:hypothetical protein
MEILAGLIRLDGDDKLPLPWYNRPSLGLMSGTPVQISPIVSKREGHKKDQYPPDLILTPLEINNIPRSFHITIDTLEKSGSIGKILSAVPSTLNISLMETVTIDQRSKHRITLVIEPSYQAMSNLEFEEDSNKFLEQIKSLETLNTPTKNMLSNEDTEFGRRIPSRVRRGYAKSSIISDILKPYREKMSNAFDFQRVVISSNTEARFVRYIFPKIGAFQISIAHKDISGAMRELTSILSQLGYNILLSRISKSKSPFGSAHHDSIIVAICEPVSTHMVKKYLNDREETYIDHIYKQISKSLDDPVLYDFMYSMERKDISMGRRMEEVKSNFTNPLLVREVVVPQEYRKYLSSYNNVSQKVIFVSQLSECEMNEKGMARNVRQAIYQAIEEEGHVVFDGYNRPGPMEKKDQIEIHSRAWRADAAIFLGFGPSGPRWLSPDQIIEWGVLHGICGKTVVCCDIKSFKKRPLMMPEKINIVIGRFSDGNYENLKNDIKKYLRDWFNSHPDH